MQIKIVWHNPDGTRETTYYHHLDIREIKIANGEIKATNTVGQTVALLPLSPKDDEFYIYAYSDDRVPNVE